MSTESKKLQTIEGFTPGPWKPFADEVWDVYNSLVAEVHYFGRAKRDPTVALIAAAPDLYRIAHEQREVIQRQDAALRAALEALELYHAYGWPDRAGVRAKLKAEIAAAAPFLELD